jgi:hypothetical protein
MIRILFATILWLGAAWSAQAQDQLFEIMRRSVEHSADYTVTVTQQPPVEARVYRTPRAARADVAAPQSPPVALVATLEPPGAFLLVPMMRMAVDLDAELMPLWREVVFGTPGREVSVTPEGTESVGGRPTIRFRVQARNARGSINSHAWVTADGIVMRVAGTGVDAGGQQTEFTVTARNVQVAAQDPNLFRIPDGFQRMQMPPEIMQQFVPGMAGGGGGRAPMPVPPQGRQAPPQPGWPAPPPPKN